jgi:AraC family transcriptional regulator
MVSPTGCGIERIQHPAGAVPVVRSRVFGAIDRRQSFGCATTFEIRYAPRAVLPMHAHASPLFLLTLEGSFDETVGRNERTCVARRLLYRPSGQRHAQRFHDRGARCLAIELAADQASALQYAERDREFRGEPALLAMRLYDEVSHPTIDTELVVEETVARLAAITAGVDDRKHERCPTWLDRIIDLIDARLATSVRLKDLAAEVNRHPVHVSRAFRRQFGCDVADFLRRRRLHEACRLIREGKEPLSAIATSTGFSDQSHMGRAFRDILGRSPGACRRSYRAS